MANTLKFGNGEWYGKKDTILAYNDENSNYKPLPFDFSRGSTPTGSKATTINKDGLIEEVGNNIPRIDYKDDSKGALLLEPSRTNSLVQSNQFDTTWINSNTTGTSGYLGLDGTNSAWLLTKTASSNANIRQNITFSGTHTFSVYLKKGTLTSVALRSTGGLDARVEINLIDGTTSGKLNTTSVKTELVGNDWWRCSLTFEATVNTAVRIYPDSITGTTAGNIYMQYAQLEDGSYATSYIPTSGSAVTRLADVCNGAGNEQVINSTEGVLYAEISALANSNNYRFIAISDGTNSNRVTISFKNDNTLVGFIQGISEFNSNVNILDFNKVALKYKSGDYSFWVNGFEAETSSSTSGAHANLNELKFSMGSDSNPFYGNVKDVRLYNTALTDQELKSLTQ